MSLPTSNSERGQWGSKLGFILAAAGSAVGLGNIWRFPSEVAEGGGAAFLIIYLICCFLVGFPVMVGELTIGRRTRKNPFGAFRALSDNKLYGLIGIWGILCGAGILGFYIVIAGWTLSFVFSEIFFFAGNMDLSAWFADAGNGMRNTIFSAIFMILTIVIVAGGVSNGIERVAKALMPTLIIILFILIGYVLMQPGSSEGLTVYLQPDFSKITPELFFNAMGQAFFSLSLGMGAMITYGSYLSKQQNIPEAAAFVTLADVGIAFIAGLLIIPTMYLAQASGIQIFQEGGGLINSAGLIFDVLPNLFHSMGTGGGLIFGLSFFLLLSMAALTSTISLLEVLTSYVIDEHSIARGKAAWIVGGIVGILALVISFDTNWIDRLALVFNDIGLPLGGLMISLFLAYIWKTTSAMEEIEEGYPGATSSIFGKTWPFFMKYLCPILIAIVFVVTLRPYLGF